MPSREEKKKLKELTKGCKKNAKFFRVLHAIDKIIESDPVYKDAFFQWYGGIPVVETGVAWQEPGEETPAESEVTAFVGTAWGTPADRDALTPEDILAADLGWFTSIWDAYNTACASGDVAKLVKSDQDALVAYINGLRVYMLGVKKFISKLTPELKPVVDKILKGE